MSATITSSDLRHSDGHNRRRCNFARNPAGNCGLKSMQASNAGSTSVWSCFCCSQHICFITTAQRTLSTAVPTAQHTQQQHPRPWTHQADPTHLDTAETPSCMGIGGGWDGLRRFVRHGVPEGEVVQRLLQEQAGLPGSSSGHGAPILAIDGDQQLYLTGGSDQARAGYAAGILRRWTALGVRAKVGGEWFCVLLLLLWYQ